MSTVTVYATGDEIGTYSSWNMSGNNNGVKLTLNDVETLGSSTDVFKIVITQVNSGQDSFSNGQFVSIYAYPESDPPEPALYSNLNPQHDQFQGRASSGEHQVITNPANIVFDIDGLTNGTVQYGPGLAPLRSEQLDFSAFSDTPPVFPCFAKGTLIETDTGPLAIDSLQIGDLVQTKDDGLQPVRWIGSRKIGGRGEMAPILIKAGALGNYRDLMVSPQHRMLVNDWQSEVYFGEPQVLVAAKHLINGDTIIQTPCDAITYVHMTFDDHQVVFAEGCPSESLHLGSMTLNALDRAAQEEVRNIFTELDTLGPPPIAHACLSRWEGRLLKTG
ncbi:Hint domain-containing protein [Octadecabacter sp. 1_MG-2023]|uniref:Hint domain-containing protein n=1 Tax=unclassified Octadecabacter TaxID=196158 RepID=UPI001C09E064|nr:MULTISPECIES: Hint domain-containing protein [unclassified Octadecabacter]MBU2993566.1 Hint domain-containing protein [Octadecabacter sp. B2R22]MDO6735590.1 Hint domain-containing protein [Octadecabacter sp. 1_MG-2023]